MSARKVLVAIFVLGIGAYSYFNVLPYHFSDQKPIDPMALSDVYDKTDAEGTFHGQSVSSYYIPEPLQIAKVLGNSDGNAKRIEVDLTNQRVYAYEGDKKVYDFLVSTGKWGRTPTGLFNIWVKLRATKMEGGNKALNTYYYLPNVPFVMFFANNEIPRWRGFSLHGTYWHDNFGHPMSHGCVNMKTAEVEQLYYWASPDLKGKSSMYASDDNPGTPVVIYGTAPTV